jgi:hypothetical protein
MSKPLKGVGYELNSTNKGFSLSIDAPDYSEPGDGFGILLNLPPVPPIPYLPFPQFQCFAVPGAVGSAYEGNTILTIVAGGVNYTNSNMPYIAEGVEQNFAQAFINKAAVLSTGVTAVAGAVPTTSLAPFMLNNGFYALLNPANKYYVVLSYYDADGDPSALDVPILAERRPWVSILQEGCTEFSKIFIEQGPSYYTGLLNIAPMTEYDDAGDPKKFFGFNHTGYFNPTKFGANVKIIAMIEAGLVTQYTNGGQNLTIPVHNHGTRMMYVPGMLEIDDPYYVNEGSDWSYVVNTADITGLAGVSYTGGWWDQVTDNTNPVAVTTHNYSYYSVSTENTDNMGGFTCSVLGWPSEGETSHRLRIKSGLVLFHKPIVDEDTGYLNSTDGNDPTDLIEYNLRINKPNIYQTDKLHIGLNDNPDYMHNDGYVELEEGSDYYVFLFKLIPDWSIYNEAKAPQLVIAKIGDTPNTAITTQINGGSVIKFTNVITNDGEYQQLLTSESFYMAVDCARKDIAYIKWDSVNSKFNVYQINSGQICLDDKPITSQNLSSNIPMSTQRDWKNNNNPVGNDPFVLVDGMYNTTYTGYTKSLNVEADIQPTRSTTASKYIPKQPSQIENPDIT